MFVYFIQVNNEEEPDDRSGSEEAHEEHKESSEHYTKSKDQELVEYLADGVKIGREMRLGWTLKYKYYSL